MGAVPHRQRPPAPSAAPACRTFHVVSLRRLPDVSSFTASFICCSKSSTTSSISSHPSGGCLPFSLRAPGGGRGSEGGRAAAGSGGGRQGLRARRLHCCCCGICPPARCECWGAQGARSTGRSAAAAPPPAECCVRLASTAHAPAADRHRVAASAVRSRASCSDGRCSGSVQAVCWQSNRRGSCRMGAEESWAYRSLHFPAGGAAAAGGRRAGAPKGLHALCPALVSFAITLQVPVAHQLHARHACSRLPAHRPRRRRRPPHNGGAALCHPARPSPCKGRQEGAAAARARLPERQGGGGGRQRRALGAVPLAGQRGAARSRPLAFRPAGLAVLPFWPAGGGLVSGQVQQETGDCRQDVGAPAPRCCLCLHVNVASPLPVLPASPRLQATWLPSLPATRPAHTTSWSGGEGAGGRSWASTAAGDRMRRSRIPHQRRCRLWRLAISSALASLHGTPPPRLVGSHDEEHELPPRTDQTTGVPRIRI